MDANRIEGVNLSTVDPRQSLKQRMEQHEGEAKELQFIADHLKPGEEYFLAQFDLVKLGISRGRTI